MMIVEFVQCFVDYVQDAHQAINRRTAKYKIKRGKKIIIKNVWYLRAWEQTLAKFHFENLYMKWSQSN